MFVFGDLTGVHLAPVGPPLCADLPLRGALAPPASGTRHTACLCLSTMARYREHHEAVHLAVKILVLCFVRVV